MKMSDRKELEAKVLGGILESYINGGPSGEKTEEFVGRRPDGYWKDWKNVSKELLALIERLGHFPTQKEIKENRLSSLGAAIHIYHGGIYESARMLGYETRERPKGYWKDWKNIERELTVLGEKLGHDPSESEIRDYDTSLNAAIRKYHRGITVVRERMGVTQRRNKYGSWKDLGKIISELSPIIQEIGHFPSGSELKRLGRGDLERAIQRHHSINAVRKAMGYNPLRITKVQDDDVDKNKPTPRDYWAEFNNLVNEINAIIEENGGKFPTESTLQEKNRKDIINGFRRHGGFPEVRKRMGYNRSSSERMLPRDSEQLTDWNWFSSELLQVIEQNGDKFPSSNELNKIGRGDLLRAINKYHGKTANVRARLGYDEGMKPKGYWRNAWNVLYELTTFMLKNGLESFPTRKEAKKYNGKQIMQAITMYFPGKTEGICNFLDIKRSDRKPNKYWHDFNNLRSELEKTIGEIGRFPKLRDLSKIKYHALAHAIQFHGGFSVVRSKLEDTNGRTEEQRLTSLLEEYALGGQNE